MKQRLTFLDLLRAWAALVMIEVHVVNAFLIAAYRDQPWFPFLNYLNGLVAPAFLFAAGFAFAFTAERAIADPRERRSKLLRNLRRIGIVLAAGYMLHMPGFGWTKALQAGPEDWLKFYQADILHTIAVGLFVLLVAREWWGGAKGVKRIAVIVGTLSILIAPWTYTATLDAVVPRPIAAYISGPPYSQFPLFPWLAFLMAGALVAATYPSAGTREDAQAWFRRMGAIGGALFVVAAVARYPEWAIGLPSVFIRANPWFVLERIEVLLLIVWVAGRWSLRHAEISFILRDVSRETLLVYVAHLLLIYGDWFDGRSLANLYARSLDLLPTVGATLVLMALMVAAAWAWQRFKSKAPRAARWAFSGGVAVAIVIFFLR